MGKKPNGYWSENKDRCAAEAAKYNTRSEFSRKSKAAYLACHLNGWLDDVCCHMTINHAQVPRGYYTHEVLSEIAKQYVTRWEFQQKDKGAYLSARSRGILDDICSHMKVTGSRKKRCIYEIVDHDRKVVYVGLTYNIRARRATHVTNEKIINAFGSNFEMKQVTEFLDIDRAVVAEGNYVALYKLKGYNVLNSVKTGALGGNVRKWNKESVWEIAKRAKTRKEFQKISNGAYQKALAEGWIDEICSHMTPPWKPAGYWNNKETTFAEARKYSKMRDFEKKSGSAYNACRRNGWVDEVRKEMLKRAPC